MDVTETKTDGLSRTFLVRIPSTELQERLDARIEEIRPQMRLKGFRPGKVPAAHVKKMFGKSIMGELIEGLVGEANQKALNESAVRAASQPQIEMDSDMDLVVAGDADLAYQIHVDAMPEFEPTDVTALSLERPVAKIEDEEVAEALKEIAEQNKQFDARGKTAKARDGDAVVIDFVGTIDGEAFEGGTAEGQAVVIGAGRFIPGFEEQLVGVKSGDETELKVTFPEDYPSEDLKGKDAVFEVKVQEVRAPKVPDLDDAFAKGLGLTDFEQLRNTITMQLESRNEAMSRQKAKRALLDSLDEAHGFDLPPNMVDQEFDQIWAQLQQEKEAGRLDEADAAKSDDELQSEYRKIAERRVRLGLVLAEIGRLNNIQITQEEVQRAMVAEARKFPGQEREVIEFFQKNEAAMAQIRAPVYEDKVVDHILEVATIVDKEVSKDELFTDEDEV